jgi:peptidoglycan lytic transglycosylase G
VSNIGFDMEQRHTHRGARRRRRRRRSAGCLAVLVSLVVVLGLGGFVVIKGRAYLEDVFAPPPDYDGNGHGSVLVEVHDGDTSTQIADSLYKAHVVASEEAFIDAARDEPRATLIQVGFYDMAKKMSADAALQRMLDPDSIVTNAVTIPEGYTVEQTLAQAADDSDLGLGALKRAAADDDRLGLPSYAEGNPEGYLFPATYSLPPNGTPRMLLRMMVDRFDESAQRLDLEKGAAALDMSPQEVVTVASIVQSEARNASDFPKVARVIYNRLDRGMPLQMDSTVHYAVGKSGQLTTTDEDRASSSPYNTYRFPGLPPGPIASPGDAALKAALHPADGDWIYFVTVNPDTGETKFAVTNAQHQRNVAQLREFCRQSPKC